jgi:hypothetical protein
MAPFGGSPARDAGWAVAPHLMRGKGGRSCFSVGATQLSRHRPKPSGPNQGAQCALRRTTAEAYRQDACGRCPRSARQPPTAGSCGSSCAVGRLLGSWAPFGSTFWRSKRWKEHAPGRSNTTRHSCDRSHRERTTAGLRVAAKIEPRRSMRTTEYTSRNISAGCVR